MKKKKVYVTLANGKVFQGYRFGADGDAVGELVFSTGMVGYMETITDPACYGQIVVQTFPLIGNYGIMKADVESDKAWMNAYIVREVCETPSNFRSEGDLPSFLAEKGVIGVYGIDTRELTKILREEGAMTARISSKKLTEEELGTMAEYKVADAVKTVAPSAAQTFSVDGAKYTVALWNLGTKNSAVRNLLARGVNVISMPANSKAEDILGLDIDGIVVGDGPGDPKENKSVIAELKKVIGKKPLFGLGLGHLLVALAMDADTCKHKYGHRGCNQPVRDTDSGRVYISTQNHGYEVVSSSVTQGKISFVNVNDNSCEGIDYERYNAFTVQFMPECCDLGNAENPLYKKFFDMMQKEKENA